MLHVPYSWCRGRASVSRAEVSESDERDALRHEPSDDEPEAAAQRRPSSSCCVSATSPLGSL